MIAFDTNVLVRLLVRDDPDQFGAAAARLDEARDADEACYLSDIVLCETVWVLTSRYGAARSDIQEALTRIVEDPRYVLDDPEGLVEALAAFRSGAAELSDFLISIRAKRRGARTTYTFDRKLRNDAGCTVIG